MKELYFCGDDYLGLGKYGKSMRNVIINSDSIIKSNDNDSFVIGIDAPWGTGKTYFVSMLENYLSGRWKKPQLSSEEYKNAEERTGLVGEHDFQSNYRVIHYDAWSNDFWNNAFEPLFDTIVDDIAGYEGFTSEDMGSALKSIGKIISIGFDVYLKKKVGDTYETLKEMLECVKVEGNTIIQGEYVAASTFPDYSSFKNAIQSLKKLLLSIINLYRSEHGEDSKIIIVVDELDRCRPNFSVQTLEIIKHLFNVNGIVFLFTLDISQLKHCVRNIYGTEFDAEGYLERFFNYLSHLPQGNYKPVIEIFNNEAMVKDKGWKELDGILINTFCAIAKRFCLSLRDLRIVLSSLQLLEQNTLHNHAEYSYARILYFYFLVFKYKKPEDYKAVFFKGQLSILSELLGKKERNIPYYVYESDEHDIESIKKSQNRNDALCHILSSDSILSEIQMRLLHVDSLREYGRANFVFYNGTKLVTRINTEYSIQYPYTLDFLLYEPDIVSEIAETGKLFTMTPMEFLNGQLEMIEFI